MRVLLVEDDVGLQKELGLFLESFFDDVVLCSDALEAFELYQSDDKGFNVVITDINMPNLSGLELIRMIRKIDKEQIFIVISGHQKTEYFLQCIEFGIFSFLLKPFDSKLLIDTMLKVKEEIHQKDLHFNQNNLLSLSENIYFDLDKKALFKDDKPYHIGRKELKLLELLIKNRGHFVSVEQIMREVWGDERISDTTLRVLVTRLRKHLCQKNRIENIKSIGYKINI